MLGKSELKSESLNNWARPIWAYNWSGLSPFKSAQSNLTFGQCSALTLAKTLAYDIIQSIQYR